MASSIRLAAHALLLSLTQKDSPFNSTFGMSGSVNNASTSACPTEQGAHIIVARASYEPPGYGIIGIVKDAVLSAIPGSTAEFVDYPATINDPPYIESESDGVVGMRMLINNFVTNCQNSPLVLMGYSQGAQVTTDSLAGQDVAGFPMNSSISTQPPTSTLSRVAAAVVMGDPSATLNETFTVGNADKDGIFPQRDIPNFETTGLASRIKSYCDAGDPYCAAGGNLTVHLLYVQEYGQQATDFVVQGIKSWYANSTGSSTGGGGATGTVSGTPSATAAPSSTVAPYTGAASTLRGLDMFGIAPVALLGGLLATLL